MRTNELNDKGCSLCCCCCCFFFQMYVLYEQMIILNEYLFCSAFFFLWNFLNWFHHVCVLLALNRIEARNLMRWIAWDVVSCKNMTMEFEIRSFWNRHIRKVFLLQLKCIFGLASLLSVSRRKERRKENVAYYM